MELKISNHIRGIFVLRETTIPPTLNKQLTNVSFYIYIKKMSCYIIYLLILNKHIYAILENI